MAVLSDDMGGITAYAAAVNRGYTGTKEEFEQLMYSYTEVAERAEAAAGNAHESEEASIEAKDIAVGAKNEAVSARDAAQSARDASISAKNNSESARDAAISAKDDTLAAKDAVMNAKSSVDETSANFSDEVTAAISDVNAAGRNQKELAKTHAVDSEAWAVGQREGADVGVSDATYHNNSKYYAEQSALAKSETETARDAAITAKDDAISAKNEAETARGDAQDIVDDINAKSEQIATNTSDITELKEDITSLENGKANIDGYYEDLVSGGSTQLLSDMVETDTTPYNYRTAGGSLEIGDRMKLKEIVGGSLAVNQLVPIPQNDASLTQDGVTITDNRDGSFTVSTEEGGATANVQLIVARVSVNDGSKVVFYGCPTGGSTSTFFFGTSNTYAETGNGKMRALGNVNYNFSIYVMSGTVLTTPKTFRPQIVNFTAMFGTTIADYVYTLETATAGAGVAWLKSHFPRIFDAGYIPYNAGTLEHVSGLSAHKMVGFNQWDEEWEQGYISNTGELQNNGYYFRSKNYIPIFPETTYFYKCPADYSDYARFAFYDADKRFLSYVGTSSYIDWTFTTPANAHYMKFTTGEKLNKSGVSYRGDICINLSDPAKNGEYEPYKAHSYPLDSTLTLRGLFKLDANNQLYADGDTYDADGTVTRKYGIVDLGTRNWASQAATSGRYEMISNSLVSVAKKTDANTKAGNIICKAYPTIPRDSVYAGSIGISLSTSGYLCVYDPNYGQNDAATFKTAMSGVMLVYELATPTIEEAEPYQHLQQCDHSGTEEYVSTGIVPVGHNTQYPENLKAKIEGLPWNFASLIAPTESTFTATRNYTTGALFIVDNVLYKATSNIANGGTITPNTNCTATTLAEIISALA